MYADVDGFVEIVFVNNLQIVSFEPIDIKKGQKLKIVVWVILDNYTTDTGPFVTWNVLFKNSKIM